MTQTTAERIARLIHDGGDIDGVVSTGRKIAAEIVALTAERDAARATIAAKVTP